MDKVPIVRVAIHARVLAHRRDEHPIRKFYFSNRERIKQANRLHFFLSLTRTQRFNGGFVDLRLMDKLVQAVK